ncbi:transposase [Chryseobacterium sp. OSA05B]|uniref:transposase n=1 Tax=Chryseobacterium sp. OSA05B TaxID=2862650 RepID=UPI001CBBB3FA|nr:transposase [Chryseobacterium sp. OSA05B]
MNAHFKDINIGLLIRERVSEHEIELIRICNFFNCEESEIEKMFLKKDLSTDILLKWSKLLKYDFFRLYSQHLILYSPPVKVGNNTLSRQIKNGVSLPEFRKHIYTAEIIEFILGLIKSGEKTKKQVICDYDIPKSTLHKWINKHY